MWIWSHFSSDMGKNLRNLRCLAAECERNLRPGERMENKSVADRQVEKEMVGGDSGDNFYLQHDSWLTTNLNIKQCKQYKQSCKVKCCSWIFKCCITSVAKLMRKRSWLHHPH